MKQRLTDIIVQEWNAINQDKDRYFPYRSVKSIFEPEQYLSILEMKCLRVRFLATTTWCATNSQQSSSLQILCYTEKLCILCECDKIEEHLFTCPLYLDILEKRMNDTSHNAVMATFENVLSSKSKTKTFRLAKFVSNATERRNEFTSSD